MLKNLFVIFIVDRSGSMSGEKMRITKEALQLFIKSVPSGSTYFQIISFGSHYNCLTNDEKPLEYNQENIDFATEKISNFAAN
jgi:uncharacterized protein YegL